MPVIVRDKVEEQVGTGRQLLGTGRGSCLFRTVDVV